MMREKYFIQKTIKAILTSFEFENWIVQQFGGTGNVKQRGDFGRKGLRTAISRRCGVRANPRQGHKS